MADSLSQACTPLKQSYDSCFNSWFEGYLEPVTTTAQSKAYSKQKADEFEANCGKLWISYKECVQTAVKEKGLGDLLQQARDEHPLKESDSPK